jgi:DNA-directed RNA polymerase specialized sigma24 family protein
MDRIVSPEDVLQDTFARAYQHWATFSYQGDGSFYRWISTIAQTPVLNVLETHQAQKRGGGLAPISFDGPGSDSNVLGILHFLARGEKSPRQLAADRKVTTSACCRCTPLGFGSST